MKQFYDKQTITHSDSPDTSWRSLLYFNLYRIFVYALFLLIAIQAWLRGAWEAMPIQNGALLLGVSAVSLVLALAAVAMIRYRRPSFDVQVHGYVFLDIVSFTLIMNAMGGVGSGVGVLLVASLGTGALLLPGRTALVFAAIASLAILGERLHTEFNGLVEEGPVALGIAVGGEAHDLVLVAVEVEAEVQGHERVEDADRLIGGDAPDVVDLSIAAGPR